MTNKKNENKEQNKTQFVVGKPCFVWKVTGVRDGKNGPTTSERTGQDYQDVDPSEPLMVLTKYGSNKALCRRPDGTEITVHLNHINKSSAYYANRAAKDAAIPLTPAQELAQAEAEAVAAMQRYEAAQAKLKSESSNVEIEMSVEDKDEVASLFEEAISA
jgi:hypothetical protein